MRLEGEAEVGEESKHLIASPAEGSTWCGSKFRFGRDGRAGGFESVCGEK